MPGARNFNFDPFVAGRPLLEQLTAERLNGILDAIARAQPLPGDGTTSQATPGGVIIRAKGGRGGTAAAPKSPFLVYTSVDNSSPPYPILKVYPGKMAGIVPTLAGAKLTVPDTSGGLKPWFYPPGESFALYLRCKVTVDAGDVFHPSITEVKVLPSTDGDVIADLESGEVPELKVKWDGGDVHQDGHFLMKIADVDMTTVEGNIVFVGSIQWLFTSYATFVIANTEAIPVI